MSLFQILTYILFFLIILILVILFVLRSRLRAQLFNAENTLEKVNAEIADNQIKNNRLLLQTVLLDTVLDNIPFGTLILDDQSRILRINDSLASLFYLDKNDCIGKKTILVFNNKNLEDLISKSYTELKPQKEEILFYGDEDTSLDIEIIPIKTLENEKTYLLILIRNATQEVEFAKLRSQFVANVSHEMRTPLTSIKGYIETVLENDLADKEIIKKYLTKSLSEVDRLSYLIEDVLDLSNIEYKRNILFKQEYNLVELISECIQSASFLAEKNDVEIEFSYDTDPIKYITDEELFRQLVKNMIENSIFHAGKGIKLNIILEGKNDIIRLIFSDNGTGIAEQDLPYIFQRFYRGKNPFSSRSIGSGLGLSIVKHIIELHNGKIEVSSIPNIETKFIISLPKKNK
ncbi:MAG: ATP-binding protein [Actinobacteria bacterium]|nr:ATP-binding protein [Actinomycetota bacterium]